MGYIQQNTITELIADKKRIFLAATVFLECILCSVPVMAKEQHDHDLGLTSTQIDSLYITARQRRQIENTLEKKIPGVYDLYKQLNSSEKRLVLKEYMKHKKYSAASKIIIRLYSGE